MTAPEQAATPRVDAELNDLADDQRGAVHYNGGCLIALARTLERELSAVTTQRDALREALTALEVASSFAAIPNKREHLDVDIALLRARAALASGGK